jgi:hypothetical protein
MWTCSSSGVSGKIEEILFSEGNLPSISTLSSGVSLSTGRDTFQRSSALNIGMFMCLESSHLEELEIVGFDVSEGVSTFLLDHVLEIADVFCFLNLDIENVVWIISEKVATE